MSDNSASLPALVTTLLAQAATAHHRRLLVLSGDSAWCHDTAHDVLQHSRLSSVVWISNRVSSPEDVLPANKASSLLGQERHAVVFDAHAGLDPDALGAVSGIISGGGLLLLLCPPLPRWSELPDPAAEQFQIRFDVIRREGNPVHDGIESLIFQEPADGSFISDVTSNDFYRLWDGASALPAIEQRDLDAPLNRQRRARRADDTGTANE